MNDPDIDRKLQLLSRQVLILESRVNRIELPALQAWLSPAEASAAMGGKMSADEIRTAVKHSIRVADVGTGLQAGTHYVALPTSTRVNYKVNLPKWELYLIDLSFGLIVR